MICPDCEGKGTVFCHVNTGLKSSGHYWGDVHCHRCKGAGSVPDEMSEWISAGRAIRDSRIANGETLLKAANRLGISAATLSSIEGGKINPNRLRSGKCGD